MTVEDILVAIQRQAPGYRYGVVSGRIVIYPTDPEYDSNVAINTFAGTRANALYAVLVDLKAKSQVFKTLSMPILRGGGHDTAYGDSLDAGGVHTPVEHLVALIQNRPSLVFRVGTESDGRLSFGFHLAPLIQQIEFQVPPLVSVGAVFNAAVKATVADGSKVSLKGSGCHVKYFVSGHGEIEIDGSGQAVARKEGLATIVAQYEGQSALIKVQVK